MAALASMPQSLLDCTDEILEEIRVSPLLIACPAPPP